MHGFDTSIPHFFSRVCGMHIVVTPICMHSITDPRAWFLLSLLEGIFIDFPSHFILSLIDVFRDSTTRDKLIFPLAITRILHHFSISFPKSPHFTVMSAIDAATVRWSKAQLKAASNKDDDSSSFYYSIHIRSIHIHSFVFCGWSDTAIMTQLVRMDACLDTLNDDRLLWVVSLLLLFHLHRLLRIRVTMASVVMMLMRTVVLARLVMMRCLLDVLTLCH